MDRRKNVHEGLWKVALEVLEFIKEAKSVYQTGWIPAPYIKRELGLNLDCYPKEKTQHGAKGWLFSTLARMLEDQLLLEYKFDGKNAYYRAAGR